MLKKDLMSSPNYINDEIDSNTIQTHTLRRYLNLTKEPTTNITFVPKDNQFLHNNNSNETIPCVHMLIHLSQMNDRL